MARKASISAGLRLRWSHGRLAAPMPCSALMLPPRLATRRRTASSTAAARPPSLAPRTLTWMLPSPAWPNSTQRAPGAAPATAAQTAERKPLISPMGRVTSSLTGTPAALIASVWASR